MATKPRIEFVDLAKGFCIILVVLAHTLNYFDSSTPVDVTIGAFRMPLYFFLSGLFFKTYEGFIGFVKRKVNKLLIPFLFFFITCSVFIPNILNAVGYEVRNTDNIGWTNSVVSFLDPEIRSFSNAPIWFLLCLFFLNIIFYSIMLLSERFGKYSTIVLCTLSIMVGVCGVVLGMNKIMLPLYIDTAMSALPFFCCGYIFNRKTTILIPNKADKWLPIIVIACGVVTYLFAVPSNYMNNAYGSDMTCWGLRLYVCGIVGTLMIMMFSKMFKQIPFVSYIGRYSIILLCTHMLVLQATSILVKHFELSQWLTISVTFVIVMISYLAIIPFCLNFMPHVTAQKDVIKID